MINDYFEIKYLVLFIADINQQVLLPFVKWLIMVYRVPRVKTAFFDLVSFAGTSRGAQT